MAKSVVVILNHPEIAGFIKGREVMAELKRRGDAVVAAAGPGHEAQEYVGKNRARVTVRTATFRAMQAEASHHRLTRAIDAARL